LGSDDYGGIISLIENAGYTFALTGAGVSTLSGIPDFRTDKSGVWDRFDRNQIFDIDIFHKSPERFYEFAKEYIYAMKNARPGAAHILLAELEKEGKLAGVATQNIDGLHQAAGSENVYELHGHPRTAHCIRCGRKYSMDETEARLEGAAYPLCDCGAPIKPDIIFYGEALPQQALIGSVQEAQRCDLLLVLGTSLVVYPAASIPEIALQAGAKVIIFNKTPTPFDPYAELVVRDDLREVCESLLTHFRG